MYKKYMSVLLLGNVIVLVALCCIRGIELNRELAKSVDGANVQETQCYYETTEHSFVGQAMVSGQRILDYELLENEWVHRISSEDYEVLLRIVEAEASGEGEQGKLLVANVVLNRVQSKKFPDTVKEVVFQNNGQTWQFSPVANGRYDAVTVSEETTRAVERALKGEDISEGALYFAARKYADPVLMEWFDKNLTFLFSYGGHEFFK